MLQMCALYVSVSFRSSLISYLVDENNGCHLDDSELPSPFGVLSFLILKLFKLVLLELFVMLPSPFGVLSFLIYLFKSFDNLQALEVLPSPFGVLSFLIS